MVSSKTGTPCLVGGMVLLTNQKRLAFSKYYNMYNYRLSFHKNARIRKLT